jgi:glycine hydroxymethyltransferase
VSCAQTIAAIAVALKQAAEPSFKAYAMQIIKNSRALAEELLKHDYKLQTDGTDNHLNLWDLRPLKLTGSKVEKVCDLAHITLNKVRWSACVSPRAHVSTEQRRR